MIMPMRLGAAAHVFMSVLILGTLWRTASYHMMASNYPTIQHAGAAMSVQY